MKTATAIAVLAQGLPTLGARILQGNDDGWAELNVRTFHNALASSGHSVLLSCPAENKSGSGSLDVDPSPLKEPCEYNSCPANSGPIGTNATDKSLNWVNSYPVTAVRYGFDHFAPLFWPENAKPDIVVSGPNVGSNLFLQVRFSGTVGVAAYAAHERNVPAIAFSGVSTGNSPWNASPVPARSTIYAELATNLTNKVLGSGTPYLPRDVFLNVNFPEVNSQCKDAGSFRWVLSRIDPGMFSAPDVDWCGSRRLPTEVDVINTKGCYIPVSIGDASDKTTINDDRQDAVLAKLQDMLTCLPS